jgi:septal ring factor EnvC (AmiA/AmiB activator)
MALRWTAEALISMAAVALTTGGGVVATAVHWGKVNAQITEVQQHQDQQDKKIDATTEALAEQKTHDARVEQKLDDIAKTVDRIDQRAHH